MINWLIKKAARDTGSGRFIAEIDGLRFVAIASVVLFHLNWFITSKTGRAEGEIALSRFLSLGDVGVQLFFVISGFVIALPFAKAHLSGGSPPRLRDYLLRRLTRLEPPYFVNLIVRYLLLTLVLGESAAELLPHLLASMGYLHNVVYGSMSSVNFVAWSLEIELQFYLLAPLLTALFLVKSKPARRVLLVLLIAACSCAAYLVTGSQRFTLSILSAAQFFLTGFLLVDVYLTDWRERPERGPGWDVVSLLSWGVICLLLYRGGVPLAFLPVPIFFAYLAAFRGLWSNRFFCSPPVYVIGGMCYTIYLYHYSVISALIRPLLKFQFWSRFPLWLEIVGASLILVPIILLVCTVLFIFIEKPCMKRDWHLGAWERIRSGRKVATAAPEAGSRE